MRVDRLTASTLATLFAKHDSSGDEFVIPEDLANITDGDLGTLREQAVSNFDQLYGDGKGLSDEDYAVLSDLTDGIERLAAELRTREDAAAERAEKAAELAARVRPEDTEEDVEDDSEDDSEDSTDDEGGDGDEKDGDESEDPAGESSEDPAGESTEGADDEAVVASSKPSAVRIPLSRVRSRAAAAATKRTTQGGTPGITDVLVVAGDGLGEPVGAGITFAQAGAMLDRRLTGFNRRQYATAHQRGRHLREQHSLLTVRKPIPDELTIRSNDPHHVNEVFSRAGDETRLPGGSLVASGGWCAPSEIVYDLVGEDETRAGLLSIPEVGVPRGGLSFTPGPDFKDLFQKVSTNAFRFTEEDDVLGHYAKGTPDATSWTADHTYAAGYVLSVNGQVFVTEEGGKSLDGAEPSWDSVPLYEEVEDGTVVWRHIYQPPNADGDKPCFTLDCPPFEEHRLDVDGLCVSAGILQQRGFPEAQARSLRGVLVAHDHIINGHMIAQMVAGSTKVGMSSTQAGATAPVLTAIELQVMHYRASRRMAENATLEAVFPFWILGAIRADLARRQGVDLIDVPDSRILGWMRARGVNPQFVYNWQALDSNGASATTAFPSTVKFLLYSAGTWIRGNDSVITLDTLYDSVMLGQNDYTALFTEEGWFVAMRGHDSRVVSVPMQLPGVVAAAKEIAWDGTAS